jgi:hypothetical protein
MAQVKGIFAAIFSIIAWEIWRTKKVDSKATAQRSKLQPIGHYPGGSRIIVHSY